ncbi:FMN-binding protein [Alkaliphilus transvaalensis]|uniref:FMN-binding protein n=1 Tax=Alkaliphilus transvaalensis TaxID=114628 RepID=UPI00047962F1|nr:FMN-binding protein [Alkaliphilus transvaalensis]
MKSKKRILKGFLIGFIVLILVFGTFIYRQLQNFSKEIAQLAVNEINFSEFEDGDYIGEYHINEMLGATLKISILDNRIANISVIEHQYGLGGKAEEIFSQVIDYQSLNVDVVSGATGSSKVLLKAIESAFVK